MNRYFSSMVILSTILISNNLSAYDSTSHKRLARVAVQRSILADAEFVKSIGIKELKNTVYEVSDTQCDYILISTKEHNPLEYFYCGAYIEDYPLTRTLHHFYDPVNTRGLIPLYSKTAPDWGLEDKGEINNLFYEQKHSYRDAMTIFREGYTDVTIEERLGKRKNFFQVLGQVAHLVEDMASPEHVRLDQHAFPPSEYEMYTGNVIKNIPTQNYNYHPIDLNTIQSARHFFSNRTDVTGLSDFTNSNFISVDTNFIKLSDGSLAPGFKYQLPVPIQIPLEVDAATELGPQYHGTIEYISSNGFDGYAAAAGYNANFTNIRASVFNLYSYEFYDQILDLNRTWYELGFGINFKTMKSAQDYLLKRAVSYSTGLINYFFRGHVEITNLLTLNQNVNNSNTNVTFTIKNITSEYNSGGAPFSFKDGDFNLYYDTLTGERRRALPIRNNSISASDPFDDQEELHVEYELNQGEWDYTRPFTLVFEHVDSTGSPIDDGFGDIGQEAGVMVKVFEPDRLLAFNIDGITGNAPIDNIINVYASADLGNTWMEFGGFALPVVDATISNLNNVALYNVIYLGNGELLAYAGYNDYLDDNGYIAHSTQNTMVLSSDNGRTWSQVYFDWSPLLVGMDPIKSVAELPAIYGSLVFTGDQNLAAIRIQHPHQDDPPRTPRSFQLYHSDSLGTAGSWSASSGLGQGGLPEVDYLGGSSYVFASYLEGEGSVGNEGGDFLKDSILARTDNGGESYYPLTDFSVECGDPDDPNNKVNACVQHLVNLGDERLLGWTDLQAGEIASYYPSVPIYLSEDGGLNWFQNAVAPFDESCSENHLELSVGNLVYIGNIGSQLEDEDVFVTTTSCIEIFEDNNQRLIYYGGSINALYTTRDGGRNWIKGELPPGHSRFDIILYTGDNGAIPGLYSTSN
ncbi:MAG: hypothetical protein KME36_15070 [Candidatus Thiodiazotropha sp. (ex Lucina pensylvanica)]|nr:hypothetical protein [Candidatus Thiodiazotropha sp. (ex Lucina pensylvanica)]MBT3052560.1 hypothetical protein [Candidatus Thiodiazotropha sp. (ex Codakia orbicularis)]